MKILTFCNYSVYRVFYKALSDVGNYVVIEDLNNFDYKNIPNHMLNCIDKIKPDIIFSIGRPEVHSIPIEILQNICREKGILNVYWATEDRTYHQKYSMQMAKYFDYIFTPAIECVQNYKTMGKGSSLLMYGCLPSMHRKCNNEPNLSSDITIAATYYPGMNCNYVKNVIKEQENDNEINQRKISFENIVYPLIEKGYKISCWGNGWENVVPRECVKGYYPYENISTLYSSTKIVLGLEWDNVSSTKTTGRPFEVLGSNSFYLSLRTKALSNLFVDRTHLALSSSSNETLDIVKYYLNNDKERMHIANEGQKEVYAKHTYFHRAGEFMNALNGYM